MAENILEIIDRIKQCKDLRDDDEVASALGMTKGNLSSYKNRQAIPYEYLSKFCRQENLSLDWLLTGEGTMRREPSIQKKEERELPVSAEKLEEYYPLYNNVRGDPQLEEILDILQKDLPEAKGAVLKILKCRKGLKEAFKEFWEIEKPIKEEG